MSTKDGLSEIRPISGDELFMETFPVHPMVAAFIALPTERGRADATINLKNSGANIFLEAGVVKTKKGNNQVFGLPEGMAGRPKT